MQKSTFSALYDAFRRRLVDLRKAAGLTQRELAKRMGREPNFIARIEQGERRVDVVEFYWIVRACDFKPRDLAFELMETFRKLDPASRRRR